MSTEANPKHYNIDPLFRVPTSLIKRKNKPKSNLAPYRTDFMRDRDRLMYSTAFRRLAGKTQIYTVGTDDHLKNRLTHTLEVAQISRTIALALGLDVDLAEAIAIGHDFGHTPFGHAGEEMLHEIMIPGSKYIPDSPFSASGKTKSWSDFLKDNNRQNAFWNHPYGFKHNLQSVRVAACLENSYKEDGKSIGLNLTNFTLYGMMRHSSMNYGKPTVYPPDFHEEFSELLKLKDTNIDAWSFEAYIVEIADDIAQWHHDLEDAMREGALTLKHICSLILEALFAKKPDYLSDKEKEKEQYDSDIATLNNTKETCTAFDKQTIRKVSSIVVNRLVTDLVNTSCKNFDDLIKSINNWKNQDPTKNTVTSEALFKDFDGTIKKIGGSFTKESMISFSASVDKQIFKKNIKESIHHSRNVERMNAKGRYIIRKLFEAYYDNPQLLPDNSVIYFMNTVATSKCFIKEEDSFKMDVIQEEGIGSIRCTFNNFWADDKKNTSIYHSCLLMRTICDHIAGMTDQYALAEFRRLYG